MGKVILDMSVSLDGFISGENDSMQQPLGDGGMAIQDWLFSGEHPSKHNDFFKLSSISRQIFDESFDQMGAMVVGRRTYDLVGGWGGSHPIRGVPVFVLTHHSPTEAPAGSTPFTFVTDGIHSAIEQARAAAGSKNVGVSGSMIAKQCMEAGLLDEIHLHISPLLLGKGVRLFDSMDRELVIVDVIDAPGVTHLKYRVKK